jgi:glyoxylase-like metal-dependent hydrolase (beta-lactamase superfamily II)
MTAGCYALGRLRLDVVSDGYFLQDAGAVFGVVPREMWEPLTGPPNERNRIPMALNCLLVRGDGRTVLIDTGVGDKIDPTRREKAYPGDYGHLLTGLAALGVRPTDVDVVVNTHLHFDHCGWNTAMVHGAVIPTFPNARYYIQRGEWEAATHPNERTRATYLADNFLPLAGGSRLDLVEGEVQVTSSIRILPAPGHTDAHAAVVITSEGQTAVYIGDLVQHAAQLGRTAWVSAFDILPLVSMETKKRVVAEALRTGALLVSPHIPYPGLGRLRDEDGRPRFEPLIEG